jgi:chromosome segregation protein
MRLRKMKLAGFKSFVDPTTVLFPSDMVGIVGPNGCGKSNIIDAVRWVMGESSKHIRGDTMEDVIFSGSNARRPVGQASIELVFDNSDGRTGGQYAQYSEIAIRRQLARDGQSKYLLNGTKCRRRDILDVFLGTGLGPRSYAIIEQGTISRLIEAKPEDLRIHLEEAAGISKYKERRRETENRIRHTRENMDRLNDLRDELEKQLNRLKRQARTAERYKELKQQERQVKAELVALRWQALVQETAERERAFKAEETRLEQVTAELRAIEAGMEQQRARHSEANESYNEVHGQFYQLGAEISRTEQAIQHARELRTRQERELAEARDTHHRARDEMGRERGRLEQLSTEIELLEPELDQAQAAQRSASERHQDLEQEQAQWQQRWEELSGRLAEPQQAAQVERARMEQLERQIDQLRARETRLSEERSGLSCQEFQVEIETLASQRDALKAQAEAQRQRVVAVRETIEAQREGNRELSNRLDESRSQAQRLRGRLASLEALQEAALGKREQGVTRWLAAQELGSAPRLAQQMSADPGWETAVETVLGQYLEAVCVDGMDAITGVLGGLEHGHAIFFDTAQAGAVPPLPGADKAEPLLGKVRAPWSLEGMLGGIYAVDDLDQALALRPRLSAGESVVTRDGLWLGWTWLRVVRDPDEHAGVLAREAEIKSLTQGLECTQQAIETLQGELAQGREALSGEERSREQAQAEHNRIQRELTQAESRLVQLQGRVEQITQRQRRLGEELEELQGQLVHDKEALEACVQRRNQALEEVEALTRERERLEVERETLRGAMEDARAELSRHREQAHQSALRLESLRSSRDALREHIQRMEEQLAQNEARMAELEATLNQGLAPLREQEQALERLLQRRSGIEQALAEARSRVQAIEAEVRSNDQRRQEIEARIEVVRGELDRRRMVWQETHVRGQALREQLEETGFAPQALLEGLAEDAQVTGWEEQIEQLARKIERLGPINLAAIDEFQQQSERKDYLDRQHADLSEALETLENAIRKIDRETRQRFKETFERVNNRLQDTFPRLFGGGQAHLELSGDDLLTTGVSVMARPPGKRLSNIHLMSGGEKALTAVALVFAIFELNPAPFCMLDEVDAPLDEANVGRFCQLVQEMSKEVQFIFITHNKTTMEYADQLVGVTMHEPGVSRMVAVDVDEAAQMATG